MRSVRQQGLSRRVEDGRERCRVAKSGARSNLAVKRPARGWVVPPDLIPSLGARRNTISRLTWTVDLDHILA